MKIRGTVLTRRQKDFLAKQHLDPRDYLFVTETLVDPDATSSGAALNRTSTKLTYWTFAHKVTGEKSSFMVS